MSLYHKYRPESFKEMVGNEEEVQALENKINAPNRPHVYLFAGHTGCGKTTAARICSKIVGAGELSIREINSGNNRGIDTIREISEQMQMLPMDGEAQVYIFDECHKMTLDAQNALLKPTEDPPEHIYFFFCTTDSQKLLPALKGRCQIFTFNPVSADQLSRIIKRVARKESIELSDELVESIAEKSEGSIRIALQLLEKIVGMEEEQALKIISGFMEEDNAEVIELCRTLLAGKESWPKICGILKSLKEQTIDVEKIRYAVLGYMQSVLLSGKSNSRVAMVMEFFREPFYNTGFPGVTLACFQSIFSN